MPRKRKDSTESFAAWMARVELFTRLSQLRGGAARTQRASARRSAPRRPVLLAWRESSFPAKD